MKYYISLLFFCAFFAANTQAQLPHLATPPEIVSAWKLNTEDILLVFNYDGSYYLIDGDTPGMERGTFSWNKGTQAFSATAIVDTNGTGGLSHTNGATTVSISGNTLNYTPAGEGTATFTRVVNTASAIVGSWTTPGEKFTVTFLADLSYYHAQVVNDVPFGYTGMEKGTYTWNSTSKAFTANTIIDTGGDGGLDEVAPGVTVNITGNTLVFTEGSETFRLTRLTTNPLPIRLPDFVVTRFANYIQTSDGAPAMPPLDLAKESAPYSADVIVYGAVGATAPTVKIGTGSPIPIAAVDDEPGSFEKQEFFDSLSALNLFLPPAKTVQFKSGTNTANLTTAATLTFPTTPKILAADGGSWTDNVYHTGDNEVLRWTLPAGFAASQYITILEIADKLTGDDIVIAELHGEVTHFDLGGKLNPDKEYEVELGFYRIDSSTTAGSGVFAAKQGYIISASSTIFNIRSRHIAPISPIFTEQPVSQQGTSGSPLTLTVGINSGAFPFANFQWFKNNIAISGQTGNSLFFPSYSELEDDGQYKVTVSSNGDAITSNVAVVAGKTPQTITFPPLSNKTIGDTAFSVIASASSELPVTFSIVSGPATISGNTITLTSAGTVVVRASQAGNDTYASAVNVEQSFTVNNASQTITFSALSNKNFGDASFSVTASASSELPVSLSIFSGPATISGNMITLTGAGTVVVRASQAGNATYGSAVNVDRSFTVSKANQTITFPVIASQLMTSSSVSLTGAAAATSSSGLPVTYSVISGSATLSGTTLTLTGAGSVTVSAFQAGNDNYAASVSVDRTFTVSKASQTISFSALANKVSTSSSFTISASASSSLPVSFVAVGPASVSGNTVTLTGDLGTVTITASQAGNSIYSAAAGVNQSFEVTAVAPPLALTNLTQTYTGTPRAIGTTGGSAPVIITYGATNSAAPPTSAGTHAVKAVSGSETITGSLIIAKAPLTITADDKTKLGGQSYPPLTVSYSGFLNTDNATNALTKAPTVTTTATKTSISGNYPITPAGATSTNYSIVYVPGNMNVGNWAGKYEALLEDPATSIPVGKIEITVLSTNTSFTGILTTAKQTATVSFKGILPTLDLNETLSGNSTATIGSGETLTTYNLSFELPLAGDFSASVTRAVGSATATELGSSEIGKKLLFPTGKPPVAYAGDYTLIFMPASSEDILPRPLGYSHATAKIDAKGKLALNMKLADGTKFSTSLYPDAEAGYRLYFRYSSRLDSYCSAWLVLQEHPDLPGRGIIRISDMQSLYWAKSASLGKDLNYRGGIPESAYLIIMDPWLPPVKAKAPNPAITLAQRLYLNSTGDMDVFHDGLPNTLGLAGLPELVRMNSAGKVEVLVTSPVNPRAWKTTITPTTGAFSGSHTALEGLKTIPVTFSGVMRQPPSTEPSPSLLGAGYSIVPQLSGQTTGTLSSAIYFAIPDRTE